MKVLLDLRDDREMRLWAKELVKSQIVSYAREDVAKLVCDVLISKTSTGADLVSLAQVSIDKHLRNYFSSPTVQKEIENRIKEHIQGKLGEILVGRDWSEIIDELAKEKIRKML